MSALFFLSGFLIGALSMLVGLCLQMDYDRVHGKTTLIDWFKSQP